MRKAKPKKRVVLPDPVFNDQMVSKFVNHLMYDGKKNVSYTIFYGALELVANKMKSEEKTPLEIWKQALENITPKLEVKSRRIGGATFQVFATTSFAVHLIQLVLQTAHSVVQSTVQNVLRLRSNSSGRSFSGVIPASDKK